MDTHGSNVLEGQSQDKKNALGCSTLKSTLIRTAKMDAAHVQHLEGQIDNMTGPGKCVNPKQREIFHSQDDRTSGTLTSTLTSTSMTLAMLFIKR